MKLFRNKKGIASIFLGLLLIPLIGLGSFVVDLSQAYTVRVRVKSAIDLAALAGISQLEDSGYVSSAKAEALEFLNNNLQASLPGYTNVDLMTSGLVINAGIYDYNSKTFTVDEFSSNINALMITYTFYIMTNLGSFAMIDQIPISEKVTVAKQPAGEAPPNTLFPIAISTDALDTAIGMSYMVNLSQSNSYLTAFDGSGRSNEIIDLFNYWSFPSYSSGYTPPTIMVHDNIKNHAGNPASVYRNVAYEYLEGNTYILPVVTMGSGNNLTVEGFVGGTINSINTMDTGNYIFNVTIIPNHIDNEHKGLKVGSGSSLSFPYSDVLANAFGIVI